MKKKVISAALGLMKGFPDGKLHEQETATIREAASALDNYKQLSLSKIDNKGVPQISVEERERLRAFRLSKGWKGLMI
ncbi:hypothetical protein [Paenibacillus apiarius]|uniref:hypothetical protein n=1 Tax=Paenibacillus apiarius TaxID=46240 RepID=UPI0019810858|nr:hypothetical protein [Paenibacillus apiarius]MBN3523251.1 hypothetical protein [Paenibacillus apiarius]